MDSKPPSVRKGSGPRKDRRRQVDDRHVFSDRKAAPRAAAAARWPRARSRSAASCLQDCTQSEVIRPSCWRIVHVVGSRTFASAEARSELIRATTWWASPCLLRGLWSRKCLAGGAHRSGRICRGGRLVPRTGNLVAAPAGGPPPGKEWWARRWRAKETQW